MEIFCGQVHLRALPSQKTRQPLHCKRYSRHSLGTVNPNKSPVTHQRLQRPRDTRSCLQAGG